VTIDPLPAEFETSREPSAEQMSAQSVLRPEELHALERCIAEHHVAEIDYTDAGGKRSTIRIRPAYIRYNSAEHLVLWGIPDAGHWEELRLDRMHSVRDTGEEFTPTW